jgi:hypothetical protein
MQPSLRLSFHFRHSLRGYTVDTIVEFQVQFTEALAPTNITTQMEGTGGYCQGKLPQYHKTPITACGYRYDRLLTVTNGWGTIHPIRIKALPLQAEVEGPHT